MLGADYYSVVNSAGGRQAERRSRGGSQLVHVHAVRHQQARGIMFTPLLVQPRGVSKYSAGIKYPHKGSLTFLPRVGRESVGESVEHKASSGWFLVFG